MPNNCKGFSMLDALLGLSILSLFFTFALPSINALIKERKHVSESMYVVTTLHNDLQENIYEDSNSFNDSAVIFTPNKKELRITRQKNNHKIKVCINWAITEKRFKELCLYGFEAN
ncbi:hypothetical protein CIB95_04625 [Lottiidibacillus patelloidae]|uniref:Prepilin-type cleavage/methylation domain-containing protein n=1 Tax=Lottiidibacillus patelloidae TaxID=2670334 RepID=A0A263BVC6_9BACI|nr:hypothetical protein [Lottiidibacillus patelloidae]OZM57660.1 hypothetical protein CIB95_04625 [Lottiidibacillus patelloidae]